MALIPNVYRPALTMRRNVKRNAMRRGIIGRNTFWRVVALGVYGAPALKRFFGKHVEYIATERLTTGQFLKVSNIAPMTRQQRRRDRKALVRVRAQAIADVEAARSES
jgi:hypothetical protein